MKLQFHIPTREETIATATCPRCDAKPGEECNRPAGDKRHNEMPCHQERMQVVRNRLIEAETNRTSS